MTGREIARLMGQNRRLADQMRAASGEFHKLVEDSFDAWGLTAAERDVAMFSIKGLSIAEIAAARGSSEGTIKAHSAAVIITIRISRARVIPMYTPSYRKHQAQISGAAINHGK